MLVIANKVDREDRVVTTQMVAKFCQENNLEFVECSAKDCAPLISIIQFCSIVCASILMSPDGFEFLTFEIL